MPDAAEVDLIRRCQEGEEDAFRDLVQRYQRRTYWIAHGMLHNHEAAREISQEAFVRVFRNIRRFDTRKNFYTWLYQIVVNLCIDAQRRLSHARSVTLDAIGELPDFRPGTVARGEMNELRGRVHRALDRLPAKYKAVLVLRDIQGFSCEEIAEIVGVTHATARWRLYRARQLFRAAWEGREVEAREDDDSMERE